MHTLCICMHKHSLKITHNYFAYKQNHFFFPTQITHSYKCGLSLDFSLYIHLHFKYLHLFHDILEQIV